MLLVLTLLEVDSSEWVVIDPKKKPSPLVFIYSVALSGIDQFVENPWPAKCVRGTTISEVLVTKKSYVFWIP